MNAINAIALLFSFVYFIQSIFIIIYYFSARRQFKNMKNVFDVKKLLYVFIVASTLFVLIFIFRLYFASYFGILLFVFGLLMYMSLKIYFNNIIKQDDQYLYIGSGIIDISKIKNMRVEKGYNLEKKLSTHKSKYTFSFIKSKYVIITTENGNVIVNKIYLNEYLNVLKELINKD